MRQRDQRRRLALGRDEVGVDRRVVPAVHDPALARPGDVAGDRDRGRVGRLPGARPHGRPGAVGAERRQLGGPVRVRQHGGHPGGPGGEGVGADARVGDRGQLAALDVEERQARRSRR